MKRLVRQSLMRLFKANFLLVFILLVGIFFRVYQFSSNPPSLNWDEVSIGYNAYSVLKTGKDEFGERFPLYFRSLDDYKMPVYVYMTAASIKLFGYTDTAVRLPSLVFGILAIYLVFALAFELFRRKEVGLLAAGITAILPWNIMFSRMASEANVAMSITVLAMLLFLKGVAGKGRKLVLSVLLFGFAAYTYLSFRAVAPLIGLTLFIIYAKQLWSEKKLWYVLLPGMLVAVFLVRDLTSPTAQIRFTGTNFLSHKSELLEINEKEMAYDGTLGIDKPRRIIHDWPVHSASRIISRAYLSHFSPDFLLFGIGHKQESSIYSGLAYFWLLPCLLFGLFLLFTSQRKAVIAAVLSWILIPPIPASITWDSPHAIRTLGLSIGLSLLGALGLYGFIDHIKKNGMTIGRFVLLIVASVWIFAEGFLFFHQYTVHVPVERSQHWQYSYRDMALYLDRVKGNYDKIIVSTKLQWPHAFMLYYTKYDPAVYLSQGGTKSGSWESEDNGYDTYEFRQIDQAKDFAVPNQLLVGNADDFSNRKDYIRSFHFLSGKPSIFVFESPRK